MKNTFLLLALFLLGIVFSQIPKITYQDFGYQKQVLKTETILFNMEDKVVIDNRIEEQNFDKLGNSIDIGTVYFSDNLGTKKDYVYKNNLLIKTTDSNSQRKYFTTITNYTYTSDNKFSTINSKTDGYKSSYNVSYNKQNRIDQIFGKFPSNYQYEKYIYKENNELWKKETSYYTADTVSIIAGELYIKDVLVSDCSSTQDKIMFYTTSENSSETIELLLKPNRVANEFLNLCDLVKDKEMSQEEFRNLILSIKDIKIITQDYYKQNENKDWIVKYSFDTSNPEAKQFYFKKITYADGTISGSIDFDIFTVNELKAMYK
uniref:hypothetical protein n=1 Tax=Flavobacterium sp. TaxID=239 RepID=UPI00404AA9B2